MKFLLLMLMAATSSVFAQDPGSAAQFVFVKESSVVNDFRFQLGAGLLDGANGAAITNYLGGDFAVTSDFNLSFGFPLAGSISTGPDSYGVGNVVFGAKYVWPFDRVRLVLGADVALPTAQADSAIGKATRNYTLFVNHQTAISPYLAVSSLFDQLTITFDVGTDLQIFDDTSSGVDQTEGTIFYDAGFARQVYDAFWATVEFGGYSTLTLGGNNINEFFAGPGFRYQDHELSFGIHFLAPFKAPANDAIDFLAVFDVRVLF